MDLLKVLALSGLLAFPAGQVCAQAQKKTESAEVRAERKKLAALEAELQASRDKLVGLKADIERNDAAIGHEIASAKTKFVKDYGRRALARNRLSLVRTAVQLYYADSDGKYPATLSALVPRYLKVMPELEIPGYEKTAKAVLVKKMGPGGVAAAVLDTGGWLYVTDPASGFYGQVFIDARAKDKDKYFFEY